MANSSTEAGYTQDEPGATHSVRKLGSAQKPHKNPQSLEYYVKGIKRQLKEFPMPNAENNLSSK